MTEFAAEFTIERVGQMHAVFKRGKQVGAASRDLSKVMRDLGRRQAIAERSGQGAALRKCLCCGRSFQSSGPENRLCSPCSNSAKGLDDQMTGGSTGGKTHTQRSNR